ncbi:DNA/RNA non-specific endonuclease [Pseudomonas sp. Sample_9]|uniref:DNA/RNA non-specific endonuclease n=1 Tax=Pseudomonas sp. Sample_9 TaxID=2382158 RepID=UPI001032BE85|nr:DNA/RNA non-specific endonuclease [Pseudomonas sp. Sample_9]
MKVLPFILIPLLSACASQQPVESLDRSDLLPTTMTSIDNCSVGCPVGGDHQTLYRNAYTLNNNGSTKFANWVAYKITKQTAASGRPREWADDGSFDTRLEWDENIRLTYVTDAHGNETWHYYDSLGYTYRIRHADGLSEWLFRERIKQAPGLIRWARSCPLYRHHCLNSSQRLSEEAQK